MYASNMTVNLCKFSIGANVCPPKHFCGGEPTDSRLSPSSNDKDTSYSVWNPYRELSVLDT